MTYHGAVTLNAWIEIVVIGLLIGNVFNLLGFIATSWAIPTDVEIQVDYEGLGLWRFCQKNPDSTELICTNLAGYSSLPGWFITVQTVVCLGFICSLLTFITIILYACAQICHQSRKALVFSILSNYAAVILNLTGVSIFGKEVSDATIVGVSGFQLSWCFILCTIAMVIFTFIGIPVVFELLTLPTNPYVKEELSDSFGESDGHVIGGSGSGGVFPGGTLEIQMKAEDETVQELTMEDPGIKSISMA